MKLELSNLQTFCRTCLDCLQSSAETLQTASVKNYDIRETPDLTKMLIICTALNINGDVDMMYPQRICSKCYHTLLEFKRFREMAIKSQEVFHGIVENADCEFIIENVDAGKRFPEKFKGATAENTDKNFEAPKSKLLASHCAISKDVTKPGNDNPTGNSTDFDVDESAINANISASSSKIANKRKRISDDDNEELLSELLSTDRNYKNIYNSNENLYKHLKEKDVSFVRAVTEKKEYTTVIHCSPLRLKLHKIRAKLITGDYTINEKRGKSKIWNIFGPIKKETGEIISGVVACRSCLNIYKWNERCTSNLIRHKCYNSQRSVKIHGDTVPKLNEMSTSDLVQHKCSSSKYSVEMQGDIVPKLNEKSTSETALETDGDIVPKICVDSECKKKGVRAFTQWSLENCRLYKIDNDSGFRNIAQYFISIGAKYGQNVDIASAFPHPTTISRNVSNIYGIIFEKVKSQINIIRDTGFGLTSDIWTDNYFQTSYIALTMHYIKEGSLFTRLLGLQSMDGEKCTHENIKKNVRDMLIAFNCDLNNNAIIVTDRGSNMVEAFDSFQHIFCTNHLINNALQKTMEEVSALEKLCSLCSKLVKYLNKSGINSSVQSTPKSYCRTHWTTTYYLLRLIQQNWTEINEILQEKNELHRINNINLTHLKGLITILKPFEESLKNLKEEHYPTIHLTIMHINRLLKKCSPESADHTMVIEFKERLRINLESTVIKNLTVYHKMALFLFPPANKMIQFDKSEKQLVKEKCKLMMRAYQSKIPIQRQVDKLIQLSASNQEIVGDYIKSTEDINGDLAINYELLMYEKNNVEFDDDFDVLHWWYQNKTEFPLLFKVSCKILATPASTAPSERIFSLARNLISENMNADINCIDQIIFANVNIGKDILRELNSSSII